MKSLPDRDLIAVVVYLANTEGGSLLLGVEDDGEVTGLHRSHLNMQGLAAFIANKTTPSVSVEVIEHSINGCVVAQIVVQNHDRLFQRLKACYNAAGLKLMVRLKLFLFIRMSLPSANHQ